MANLKAPSRDPDQFRQEHPHIVAHHEAMRLWCRQPRVPRRHTANRCCRFPAFPRIAWHACWKSPSVRGSLRGCQATTPLLEGANPSDTSPSWWCSAAIEAYLLAAITTNIIKRTRTAFAELKTSARIHVNCPDRPQATALFQEPLLPIPLPHRLGAKCQPQQSRKYW